MSEKHEKSFAKPQWLTCPVMDEAMAALNAHRKHYGALRKPAKDLAAREDIPAPFADYVGSVVRVYTQTQRGRQNPDIEAYIHPKAHTLLPRSMGLMGATHAELTSTPAALKRLAELHRSRIAGLERAAEVNHVDIAEIAPLVDALEGAARICLAYAHKAETAKPGKRIYAKDSPVARLAEPAAESKHQL